MSLRLRLQIERGSGSRAELTVTADRVSIGRGPGVDFPIDDAAVSALHCEIRHTPEGLVIRDLDSEHGTWVSGIRVKEACLPDKARIKLGDTEISCVTLETEDESKLYPDARFGELIGESHAMRMLFTRLARAAVLGTTLFLEGESGTGKDLAARAVHEASARASGPFVVVDCSFPRDRVEEELFGRDSSSNVSDVPGPASAFVRAHGGTLFLDEIGGLDLDVQPLLLRALEAHEVKPAGAQAPVPVDVRIVASTHQDLRSRIRQGTFREDLYYRLAVMRIRLPPLREHTSDIPLLVAHFLAQHERDDQGQKLDEAALQRLKQRTWPGNVRELRNAVEQVLAFGREELDQTPESEEPPSDLRRRASARIGRRSGVTALPFKLAKSQVVERFEREYLAAVLGQCGGNITAAAAAAELDRVHFLRLLDRHGLRPSRPRTV